MPIVLKHSDRITINQAHSENDILDSKCRFAY